MFLVFNSVIVLEIWLFEMLVISSNWLKGIQSSFLCHPHVFRHSAHKTRD